MSDSWFDYDKRIKVGHLEGGTAVVQIARISEVDSMIKKEKQPVLYFNHSAQRPLFDGKYLILNDTNRGLLVEWFGHQKSACIGQWVELSAKKMQNGKWGVELGRGAPSATAPTAPTSPAYDWQARKAYLKQLRDEWTALGGVPPATNGRKFKENEMDAFIGMHEEEVEKLRHAKDGSCDETQEEASPVDAPVADLPF